MSLSGGRRLPSQLLVGLEGSGGGRSAGWLSDPLRPSTSSIQASSLPAGVLPTVHQGSRLNPGASKPSSEGGSRTSPSVSGFLQLSIPRPEGFGVVAPHHRSVDPERLHHLVALPLMAKVRSLGIIDEVGDWIEDWLSDRKQRVVIKGTSSGWREVTSGVPRGSVLGPLLFIIYINDLDLGLVSKISKFADDTKMGINADSDAAVKQLQEDLRKVGEWSKKWQMPFNLDKCKIMHIGHKNINEKYELLGKEIESVQQEKDLGVVITNDLKSSNQCIEAVKKAQKLLGYIKRQFRTRNKETILTLYNALVRPHLEYAVQFWSPSLRKDIERLEAVQARATKLIPSIRHLGYVRRLERLNLYSLEKRQLRGQLIET